MEKVSIVIPVYNVEEYLQYSVGSLRQQTYSNIEIILVDDGSTDRSGEICDQYAQEDDRIRVLHLQNGGLSNARNTGGKRQLTGLSSLIQMIIMTLEQSNIWLA